MTAPAILRGAHGKGAAAGDVLAAETPPLPELGPVDAARTADGLALLKARGRPYQRGNRAAADRGPSLARIGSDDGAGCDPEAPEERRRARRKAASLKRKREAELFVQTGGPVSSAVKVELVAWARAAAWAELYDRAGDAVRSVAFAEKASTHGLRALGIAEREGAARAASAPPVDPLAALRARAEARRRAAAEEAARCAGNTVPAPSTTPGAATDTQKGPQP